MYNCNAFWKKQQAKFFTKKKKPPVNKYSRINLSNISPEKVTSTISKKRLIIAQTNLNTKSEVIRQEDDYFLFVYFSILKSLFQPLLVCPEYGHKKVTLSDNRKNRKGFAHNLEHLCESCEWYKSVYTSKECIKQNHGQGPKIYEANARAEIGFREIGKGFTAMETFYQCMNMFSLSKTPFSNLNDNEIYTAYEKAALNSMKKAAEEAQDKTLNIPIKKRVTIDGSWQKRGFTSLNGVVTAVVNNKIIDTKAFSKHCKGCSMWKKHRGSPAYNRWKADHICHISHTKSSGAMEAAGALEIFSRSIEKHNLIYHDIV